MTQKPPYTVKSFEDKDVPQVNSVIARAYQTRVESVYKREGTSINQYLYQSIETGEVTFSANGASRTVVQTYGFKEKQSVIVFAQARAISGKVTALVTDITNTGIEITCKLISSTLNFSQVVTQSVKVFFEVRGSNP